MIVYLAGDIPQFVMYCVNGKPRSSLFIESTDSMILRLKNNNNKNLKFTWVMISLHLRSASTEDQARLDVVASGVWGGRFERTFLDVRVFNPNAPSNRTSSLPVCNHRESVMNRKSGGAMTGGSGRWSGLHFCGLFYLLPETAARVQLRC